MNLSEHSSSDTAARVDSRRPHSIRLKLHDMNQPFNSTGPLPFIERGLDRETEEFIVSWAQEMPPARH